jgi:serine protease Do
MVGRTPAGEEAELTVVRNGKVISVPVVIGTLDEEELTGSRRASSQAASGNRIGISVVDLEEADRRNLEVPRGVVVRQVYSGPARDAGIQRGDVITNFDGEPIDSVQQLESLIRVVPADSTVHCRIVRNKRPQFIAIRVPAE